MSRSTTPASTELRLSYLGLVIAIRTANRAHLLWLEEFLAPHFAVAPDRSPDCEVELEEDDAAYAALRARRADPTSTPIDCFALDSSVVQLPLWPGTADGLTVYDDTYRAFYSVSHDRARITLLTGRNNGSIRTPLMRVVRELAMNHCHARGDLVLHASAAAVGQRGLIVTGRKAAGKSTLLMYLLGESRAHYLANDRVLVTLAPTSTEIRGLPSVVTIRPRTLELFPTFRDRLAASGFRQQLTVAEAAAQPAGLQPWNDGRHGMTPAQFCQLLGSSATISATPAALIFPQVTEEPGGIALQRLAIAAAAERLGPSLLGAGTWKKTSDFFTLQNHGSPGPDQQTLTALCRTLAERVPCFECQLGLQSYRDGRGRTELLALLHGNG